MEVGPIPNGFLSNGRLGEVLWVDRCGGYAYVQIYRRVGLVERPLDLPISSISKVSAAVWAILRRFGGRRV